MMTAFSWAGTFWIPGRPLRTDSAFSNQPWQGSIRGFAKAFVIGPLVRVI